EYRLAVEQAGERLKRLEQEMVPAAESSPHSVVIAALQALRGVGQVTATCVVAEMDNLTRFANPRQAMAYVGLTPCETSSGGRVRRGHVTKTGNSHVRYLLVEAAWHYRHPPRVSETLKRRQAGQSE